MIESPWTGETYAVDEDAYPIVPVTEDGKTYADYDFGVPGVRSDNGALLPYEAPKQSKK